MALAGNIERPGFSLSEVTAKLVSVKLDNSYPAGGSSGLANLAGFDPEHVIAVIPLDQGAYHISYGHGLDKLRVFQQGAGAGALTEVAAGVNLSGTTVRLLVLGE